MYYLLFILALMLCINVFAQDNFTHYINGKWYDCDEIISFDDYEVIKGYFKTNLVREYYKYHNGKNIRFYDLNKDTIRFSEYDTVFTCIRDNYHKYEYTYANGKIYNNDTIYDNHSFKKIVYYLDSIADVVECYDLKNKTTEVISYTRVPSNFCDNCFKVIGSDSSVSVFDKNRRTIYSKYNTDQGIKQEFTSYDDNKKSSKTFIHNADNSIDSIFIIYNKYNKNYYEEWDYFIDDEGQNISVYSKIKKYKYKRLPLIKKYNDSSCFTEAWTFVPCTRIIHNKYDSNGNLLYEEHRSTIGDGYYNKYYYDKYGKIIKEDYYNFISKRHSIIKYFNLDDKILRCRI